MNTKKISRMIFGIVLGLAFFGAAHQSAFAQPSDKERKQAEKQAKKQAEVDRKNAEQQRKVEAEQQKQMLKMRDVVSVNGVGEKAKIELQLRDNTKIKGWVSQLTMTDFVVNDAGSNQPRTISYRDVTKAKGKNPAAKKKGGGVKWTDFL